MKKYLSLVLVFVFGVVFLTGCGSSSGGGNKVVCTGESPTETGTYKGEITATIKDDKVSEVSAVMEFTTEEEATQYVSLLKLAEAFMSEGTDLGISSSGKKVTIKNMTELLKDATDDEGNAVTVIGGSKEDFIKYAEAQQYTCK